MIIEIVYKSGKYQLLSFLDSDIEINIEDYLHVQKVK